MILAIDPGLKGLGCAEITKDGKLRRGWFIRRPSNYKTGSWSFVEQWIATLNRSFGLPLMLPYRHFVIEGQYLSTRQWHQRPEDILRLSFLTGTVTGHLAAYLDEESRIHVALPRSWKGTVPAKVMQQRIYGKLTPGEIDRLEQPGQRQWYGDILTACALGKWYYGRLEDKALQLEDHSRAQLRRKWAKQEPAS